MFLLTPGMKQKQETLETETETHRHPGMPAEQLCSLLSGIVPFSGGRQQ